MKEVPYNPEVEMKLIGTMMSLPAVLSKHIGEIPDSLFHSHAASKTWQAVKTSYAKHGHAKPLTVSAILRASGDLDAIGGPPAIIGAIKPSDAEQVPALLHILTEHAQARALVSIAAKLQSAPDVQSIEMIAEIRTELDRVEAMAAKAVAFRPFGECMVELLIDLQAVNEGRNEPGLGTGFYEIDRMLNGMKPGQMIVLAARPSIGKTALGVNIATNLAALGVPVGVFSMEMSSKELMGRIVTAEARASIRTAEEVKNNIDAINSAAMRMIGLPLYVDDSSRLTVSEIRGRTIEMQAKHGVRFIVIDYLTLIKAEGVQKGANREQEVASISKGIKAMAKELNIPIMVLAQLSRGAEGKERPNLSQLRESGQIESDADVVAFIHRDRQAQQTIEPGESVSADIIIEKNRSGPCGLVKVAFFPDCCRFDNAAHNFGGAFA